MISALTSVGVMIGLSAINRATREWNTSLERLATGKRINRASDDPSGLVTSEAIAAELRSIEKEMDRSIYEETRLGAIDGAQSALSDLLLDLNGLVVQSANRAGMSESERAACQMEADSILQAIDHVAATTTFGGQNIMQHLNSQGLGIQDLASGRAQNLLNGDAEQAQETIKAAIDSLATQRAGVGIRAKDIQSDIRSLQERFISLSDVHSRIVDTDYAAESARLVRASVLREAALFVTQIALGQNAQVLKSLLR